MADDRQTKRRSRKRETRQQLVTQELHVYLGDGREYVITRVKTA